MKKTILAKRPMMLLSGAIVLGVALLWTGDSLWAQSIGQDLAGRPFGLPPRIPMTRDGATKSFVELLEIAFVHSGKEPDAIQWSSISRSSEKEYLFLLLEKMALQWTQPNQVVKVQREDADSATVVLETVPLTASRPLVLVREGESWGVDVVETYALWNGLQGAAKIALIEKVAADFSRKRDNARRSSCQSNLKQVALGIMQYVQDYDEKLPPARSWIDVLQPYVRSEQIFVCPSVTDAKGYGYAYNSKLSQKGFNLIPLPSETIAVYETTVLKRNAYGMGENRAYRHFDGGNYAFADGHIKWFKKGKIEKNSDWATFDLKR